MTALVAGATWFWAASEHLSHPVRLVLAAAVLVIGFLLLVAFHLLKQIRPPALPEDLARSHISHLTFRIVDLAREEVVIRDKVFESCTVYGPAILAPVGSAGLLLECHIVGTPEQVFWPVDAQRKEVVGAIGLEGCYFRRCRLIRIGFVGSQEQLIAKGKPGS